MYFYFDRERFFEKKVPIYWERLRNFVFNQSCESENTNYVCLKVGNNEKKCFIGIDPKETKEGDYSILMFDAAHKHNGNLYWGRNYADESIGRENQISFLPCAKSIKRKEDAEDIIFLVDQNITPSMQIMVDYLASLFKKAKIYKSNEIEWNSFSDIEADILCCKKFISFSNHKILNQYFSVLFGNNFVLCNDDQSSPLRYVYANMKHPNLREKAQNCFDKDCEFKYSFGTSNLRNLVTEIAKNYEEVDFEITPEMVFKEVERQCFAQEKCAVKNYLQRLKSDDVNLPFMLAGWAKHKKSLSELMLFVEQNKEDEDMKKLLLSYLLVYMPIDYWRQIEQRYANDLKFCSEFKKSIDAISENSHKDYTFKWACGTYIRALKDHKNYVCSWNGQSLATCLDLALNQREDEIIGKVKQLYSQKKYKDSLGLNLVKVFVDNALIFKSKMRKELIDICYQLLDLDENYGQDHYGVKVFYKTILLWLENRFNEIITFLNQAFDGLKTQGFLAKTALFLLKQKKFDFKAIAVNLLALEDNMLLSKNPEILQIKIWAYLEIKDEENANVCLKLLRQDKQYFQTFRSGFSKWYLQSHIEHQLNHFAREKRFKFVQGAFGDHLCLWEGLE